MRRKYHARGFSLVELMIAILICGIAIAAAAKLASSAFRSSQRGTQSTDLGQRARLLSRQLRADLRLAGQGSTGAIGVAPVEPWLTMSAGFNSGMGRLSIPAVSGANNIAPGTAMLGRNTPAYVTDAIQLVVPDPSTRQQTTQGSARLSATIFVPNNMSCPRGMIYISDHASSNGGGRTQIAQLVNGAGAGPVSLLGAEVLEFELPPGADVMCARVSTYWVGIPPGTQVPWLYRSDVAAGGPPPQVLTGASGRVHMSPAGATDSQAPGVWDLQIAYAFSSELAGLARTATPNQRWAFAPAASGGIANPAGSGWFEVREVRFNMIVTSLRRLQETGAVVGELAAEDGQPIPLPIERGRFRLTAGEPLTSLRYFDKVVPSGITAEPY